MAEQFEYVVVGLGALGSATAYRLAKQGHRVLGLERFERGHSHGASHDSSRILRHSYHTPNYVRLTCDAYDDWAELEADSGEALVTTVGGLDLFPPDPAIAMSDYVDSLDAVGIDYELLDVAQIGARWPQFALSVGTVGLYQQRAAIVPAGRGTAVMQRRAAAYGAVLRDRSPVTAIRDLGSQGMAVDVGNEEVRARVVVVCADAWTNHVLAGIGTSIPLDVTLEQVTYFAPKLPELFAPGRLPLWIWMDDPSYYGFPCYGETTVKASQDCGGPSVDPDRHLDHIDGPMLSRLALHMHRILPESGSAVRSLRCQYALTPDRDFVLAAVPGHPQVVVGLGAAHGFKFAPTFGRLLAELATTGTTATYLYDFRLDRPALTDPSYAAHWLV
ncbi:MAG: N-methyl-L-tryptophan oxidase [Nocardioidaceae bacterium]